MINTPSEIVVSKLEFSPVKLLDNGGKSVNIRYEGRNIMVETPSLNVPYGVNVFDKTPGAPPKFSVDLSLGGASDNDQIQALQTFLEAFDERMIDAGVDNAKNWFKMGNPSREVIKAFYSPLVKVSLDKTGAPKPYPPTFKLALRKKFLPKGSASAPAPPPDSSSNTKSFDTKFYNGMERDEKGQVSEFEVGSKLEDVLAKRAKVTAIIQCTGVWFAGGKFGTTWKAAQLRVDSQPEQIRGPAFRSDAPDIRAFVAKATAAPVASSAAAAGAGAGAGYGGEDEDEEEDEEQEQEQQEAPAPAPAPKKVVAAVAAVAAPAPAPAAVFTEEQVTEPISVPVKLVKAGTAVKKVPKKATA
jgi:hypothetical protein